MSDKKRILVIDDDPDIVYTIKEICLFAGYDVMTANDGIIGIELFKTYQPNMIIVDYHMPKYDGLTTVRKIRELEDTTVILVLTVDERQSVLEKFMEVGATDFAVKPVIAPDLIARINVNIQINEMQIQNKKMQESVYVDKGISNSTLKIIEAFMGRQTEAMKIKEIANEVKLAYQTVHRYVQYMIDNDQIEVITKYGKVGRPTNYYRLK